MVCQEDCDFSEYDYDTLVAKCSCKVKDCTESFADMKINKRKLLENFKNIKNIINFEFLKCYNKLLCKEGILKNFGFYILLLIILFHIISIFVFIIKHYPLLKKKIKKVISFKKNENNNIYKISKKHRLNTNKNSKLIIFFIFLKFSNNLVLLIFISAYDSAQSLASHEHLATKVL